MSRHNQSEPTPRTQLFLLTFAHAVVDTYATTLPHLLPMLLRKLAIPKASWGSLTGSLVGISGIFNSLSQVLFGHLADRTRTVHFLTFGVALPTVCTSLLGTVPSLLLVIGLLVVGGSGVAAFHPQAAVQAAALAKQGRGFGVSLFITGGNVGQAIGPFSIMLFLGADGLNRLMPCMIPGLLVALLVAKVLSPNRKMKDMASAEALSVGEKREKLWLILRPQLRQLIVLYLIAVLRTVTTVGLVNFLSLYLDQQEYSNLARSGVLSLFIFAGSMGIMAGGSLSDRINRYGLLLFSLIIAPPLLYASLHTTGILYLALLFLGNFILSSSITVNIVWAQQLLPGRENIASSFMMGAAWGMAGILNIPVGMLGDSVGLPALLDGLVMLPLVTSVLMVFLRRD